MTCLYNEVDPYACDWLENLSARGLIAPGRVDRRSIVELRPSDVADVEQAHSQPLVDGAASRMGPSRTKRLKGYGNAICAPLAATFIRAAMDALVDGE